MFITKSKKIHKHLLKSWTGVDLEGYQYGMLTYTKRLNKHKYIWWARCICGRDVLVMPPAAHYKGKPLKSSCGCSGNLEQDYSDKSLSIFIMTPWITHDQFDELYDIWLEQIVKPSTSSMDNQHCVNRWLSFYCFCLDVTIPPQNKKWLMRINKHEPLSNSNYYWTSRSKSSLVKDKNMVLFNVNQ